MQVQNGGLKDHQERKNLGSILKGSLTGNAKIGGKALEEGSGSRRMGHGAA